MQWTLEKIRAKTRKLSGRLSSNQLSQSDLDDYINNYYQNVLPKEIYIRELEDWYSFDTSGSDDGEYSLPNRIITIGAPITADGYPVTLYTDRALFYAVWPETQSYSRTRPSDMLWYGDTLVLRPPPDDVYTIKMACIAKPDAMTDAADTPIKNALGDVIAAGAAVLIMVDNGEIEEADEIGSAYKYYLQNFNRDELLDLEKIVVPRSF